MIARANGLTLECNVGFAFACERRGVGFLYLIRRLRADNREMDSAPRLEAGIAVHKDAKLFLHDTDHGIEAGISGGLFPDDADVNGAPGFRTGFAVYANAEFFLNSANGGVDAHTGGLSYQVC
jgi:hypothetical protein